MTDTSDTSKDDGTDLIRSLRLSTRNVRIARDTKLREERFRAFLDNYTRIFTARHGDGTQAHPDAYLLAVLRYRYPVIFDDILSIGEEWVEDNDPEGNLDG